MADIGTIGEDFVASVMALPFASDFVFRGQHYRDGKRRIELCDLFVLFDNTAIIIEVKTANREEKQGWDLARWASWTQDRTRHARTQIDRATRALRSGLVRKVENGRQGLVKITQESIKQIFAVMVIDSPDAISWSSQERIQVEAETIPAFIVTHATLIDVLRELSTIPDFIDYLHARMEYLNASDSRSVCELDLLATYKVDPEKFIRQARSGVVSVDEGAWKKYASQEELALRERLDVPSYLVDEMISKMHEARHAKLDHIDQLRVRTGVSGQVPSYIEMATELARNRRIDRRHIGIGLIEKSTKCVEQQRDRYFVSAPRTEDGSVVVFMVSLSDRKRRLESLTLAVYGAMLKQNAIRAMGFVTEPVTGAFGFSIDAFGLSERPEQLFAQFPPDVKAQLTAQFTDNRRSLTTEFGQSDDPYGPAPIR